jgi:hypothetical protein
MALQASAQSAPPNDNLADAYYLHAAAFTVTQSSIDGAKQAGEPDHAGETGAASIWWSWVAPVSGTVQLDTIGSDFDTLLAVYTGYDVANLQPVASDDQSGGNDTSLFVFHDGTFEERIPMLSAYTSWIELDGRLYALGADDPDSGYNTPHRIDRLGEYAVSAPGNALPTVSIISPSGGTRIPEGLNVTISAAASDSDGSIQRVEFLIDEITVGSDLTAPYEFELVVPTLGGRHIQARVWDDVGAVGYSETIAVTVTPENDDFANRTPLTGVPASGSGVNRFADTEPDEPTHADSPGRSSVWWS